MGPMGLMGLMGRRRTYSPYRPFAGAPIRLTSDPGAGLAQMQR